MLVHLNTTTGAVNTTHVLVKLRKPLSVTQTSGVIPITQSRAVSALCKLRDAMRSRIFLLGALAFTCLGQDSSTPQVPVTTFQSATRLVVLDVVVTDKQGKPVSNLSKDDFTIVEDGTQQTVASFEPPDQHAPVTVEAHREKEISRPENAPQKIGAEPLTILVFDALDTKILDQAYARHEIKKYLVARGPLLAQPTALMALEEKRLELLHDYTRDAGELQDALQGYRAELPFRMMADEGMRLGAHERSEDAIAALREIATSNTQFAGRKNVVWIGQGFPSLNNLRGSPAQKARVQNWGRETLDLISQARMSVYTIDPRGLQVFPEEVLPPTTSELALESITLLTGGRIVRGLNDVDAQIASSIENGGTYYAISYYPSNRNWDGQFRRVRVVIRNPDFVARTRAGYFAYAESTPTYAQLDTLLSRALVNPLPYHALNIEAQAKLSGSQTRTAHMHVTLDASGLHWQIVPDERHRCEITLVAAGFSSAGKVVTNAAQEFEITVDEKKYAELMNKGMVMNLVMRIPPTAVRMRVVTRDSTNGNIGTADLTPEGQQFH